VDNNNGWVFKLKRKDISIYANDEEESNSYPVKSLAFVKAPIESIIQVITSLIPKRVKKWNKSILEINPIEKISSEYDIIYTKSSFF